jgi:hypothetical protein
MKPPSARLITTFTVSVSRYEEKSAWLFPSKVFSFKSRRTFACVGGGLS